MVLTSHCLRRHNFCISDLIPVVSSGENKVNMRLDVRTVEGGKVRRSLFEDGVCDDEVECYSMLYDTLAITVSRPMSKAPVASETVLPFSDVNI